MHLLHIGWSKKVRKQAFVETSSNSASFTKSFTGTFSS